MKDVVDAEMKTSRGRWLETAYALHAATCRLYAHSLAPGAADDVVQEAFVRLVRRTRRAEAGHELPDSVRPWLLRAVRSAAVDLLRAESRRRRRERLAAREAAAILIAPADVGLEAHETAAALGELDSATREVVVLRIWGELTFAEIADLTGMGLSTAHAAYGRGLNQLRAVLEPDIPAETGKGS